MTLKFHLQETILKILMLGRGEKGFIFVSTISKRSKGGAVKIFGRIWLELRGLAEWVVSGTGFTRGDGVGGSVVSGRFAREEVVAEESLSGHDREVAASERGPGVDDEEDDHGKVAKLLEHGDGHETHPNVLRTPDEDNERKKSDPRTEGDGPANVEGSLIGQSLKFERLPNVEKEPSSNQRTNYQDHDSWHALVEIVDDGTVCGSIVPNEQCQIQNGQ